MALTYVGTLALASTGAAISLDLTALAGGIDTAARTNDLVIVCVSTAGIADRSIGVTTADYTELGEFYANGSSIDTNLSVNYKLMGATPDTSVDTTASGGTGESMVAIAYVWRGVDTTNILDVTRTIANGTYALPTPPPITPITTGAIIICIGAGAHISGQRSYLNPPTALLSSFTSRGINFSYDASLGMGFYSWTSGEYTPGKFGVGSFSDSSGNTWYGVSIVLRPSTNVGPANIKSYNTNLKANIKTINTNPIANVKTLNTNA